MILPDLNLLVYAYNSDDPAHRLARSWWETCLSENRTVGLAWVVILGYLRLMTSRSVLAHPFSISEAFGHIHAWLERPQVEVIQPGARHLELMESLMRESQATGSLVTDLHLAALAIEHGGELHSNDSDFSRFPRLRWTNPLS